MSRITCELCSGTEFTKEDGFFVCQGCGCKYSIEEAKKLMSTEAPSVSKEEPSANNDTQVVDSLLKLASDIIIVYINRTDENGCNTRISESEYIQAKKYLEQAAEKAPNNWNVWFLKGLLAELQNYDSTDPTELQEFERAMRTADDETIRTRILPHISKIEKEYINFYESDDYIPFGDCTPVGLNEVYLFFKKFEIAADYAQEASEELERLQPLAEKRKAERDKAQQEQDNQHENALSEAVRVIKEYEQKMIEAIKEDNRLDEELRDIRKQIDNCGFFDGKKKTELLRLRQEKIQSKHTVELKFIQDEAVDKFVEYTGGMPSFDNIPDYDDRRKEREEFLKAYRYHFSKYCRDMAEKGTSDYESLEVDLREYFVY